MARFQKSAPALPHCIGDILRQTREHYGLQIEEVAEVLCIQKKNLEHLESNAFFRIPEALYRELFLKTYSTYLGLDWESLREQYKKEQGLYACATPEQVSHHVRRAPVRTTSLWNAPNMIRNAFLSLCICGGFLYIAFIGWNALQPPQLVIFQPQQEFSSSSIEEIVVSGQTKKEAHVAINGQQVVKKQDGTFSQGVALRDGLNVITITVSKKFSRPRVVTRNVVFEKKDEAFSYKSF